MKFLITCLSLVFGVAVTPKVYAQEPVVAEQAETVEISKAKKIAYTEALNELTDKIKRLRAELAAAEQDKNSGVRKLWDSYYESHADFYQYEKELRGYTKSMLSWQLFSSYVLLFLVVIVTILGVALSFLEVRSAINLPKHILGKINKESGYQDNNQAAGATTVTLSPEKLQVTSAVTGVVILVLSLGFLYIFVDKIFELKPTDFSTIHRPEKIESKEGRSSGALSSNED